MNIVRQFEQVGSATAHEAMGRKGYIDCSIKPLYPGMKLYGTAVTCQCHEMDNITLHAALHIAGKGDIIVCTMGDYAEQGPFGDCMATCAKSKGISGLAINTGVRDGENVKNIGFPIFCKGHCINGTVKEEFGTLNLPVTFGGQVVNPGDIIIGDDDGLVVIPKEQAAEILEISLKRLKNEVNIREQFMKGVDSWALGNYAAKLKAKGYDINI
jgi:4-hydroxy-4-methyl-2-oxoglutarate aldolase